MLLSMTGHGQALVQDDAAQVLVEVRTVNNRFLKINVNGDLDSAQTSELENLVKKHLNRGSVNLRVKIQQLKSVSNYRLNPTAVKAYVEQAQDLFGLTQDQVDIGAILNLPGSVEDLAEANEASAVWPLVQQATTEALQKLTTMRQDEGKNMAVDLAANCDIVERQSEQINDLAPRVIDNYAKKITDRINQMLENYEVTIQASDVVREVGMFAERVDISEEIVRLRSHVGQFRSILAGDVSNGRKLDFLTQEMLRETNTIGSKANDAEIATHVVEIKTAIERIREMVQNVE